MFHKNSKVIFSQVIFKVKVEDDKSLKLRAGIALHGNGYSLRDELRSDCKMLNVLASWSPTASIFGVSRWIANISTRRHVCVFTKVRLET